MATKVAFHVKQSSDGLDKTAEYKDGVNGRLQPAFYWDAVEVSSTIGTVLVVVEK